MIDLPQAWQRSFTEHRYRIGLHVLFWLGYYMIIGGIALYITFPGEADIGSVLIYQLFLFLTVAILVICYFICVIVIKNLTRRGVIIWRFIGLLIWMLIFIHLYYFFKVLQYYIMSGLGLEVSSYLKGIASKGYWDIMSNPSYLAAFTLWFFLIMFIPLGCKYFRDQFRAQKKQEELNKQNMQLEMNFLKAQIHPHFLFNTLNNIYSLITHNEAKKSAEMVSGLSSLLRYALYDGRTEFISLEKEIGMLKDFIALEEVRSDDLNLEVQFPTDIPVVKIPPFLLLPLVENAFKHGVNSQLKRSCVKIDLHINEELSLLVQNTFAIEYRKKNSGGFGLLNLKKRLDYYYEDQYFLKTDEKENVFTAILKLPLSCPKLSA